MEYHKLEECLEHTRLCHSDGQPIPETGSWGSGAAWPAGDVGIALAIFVQWSRGVRPALASAFNRRVRLCGLVACLPSSCLAQV